MEVSSLRTLYLSQLQELCDGEAQLARSLLALPAPGGSTQLRSAVAGYATKAAIYERCFEAMLRRHGASRRDGCDQVAAALLEGAGKLSALLDSPDLHDAALIGCLRRIKHQEIAASTTVAAYAAALLLDIDRRTLLGILTEKWAADHELEGFEGEANQLALLVSTPAYA